MSYPETSLTCIQEPENSPDGKGPYTVKVSVEKKDEWNWGKATKHGDECPHQRHINKLSIDLRSHRQGKNEEVSKMLKEDLEDRCGRKQQQICIRPIKIIKFKKSVIKSSSGQYVRIKSYITEQLKHSFHYVT